jgi:hypothetical protein
MILVNMMNFRPEEEAEKIIAPLLALKPVQQIRKVIGFASITDAAEPLNKQGGLKTQISCGLQKFSARKFELSLDAFTKLVDEHPSASGSFFMSNWYSTEAMKKLPDMSAAYSHRDCGVWSMSFVTSPEPVAARAAVKNAEDFVVLYQEDQSKEERALFPNHTRVHSLEERYRGAERREKLAGLKRVWDPEGVFTRQFL